MDNKQCIDILRKIRQRALSLTSQQLVMYIDGQIDLLDTVSSDITEQDLSIPVARSVSTSKPIATTPRFRGADMT